MLILQRLKALRVKMVGFILSKSFIEEIGPQMVLYPGVVSAATLLENPKPSVDQVRHALSEISVWSV